MIVPARLAWAADGTPRSEDFDDVYHSSEGGLAQARHVFIAGNHLPLRWQDRRSFTILETGFGLGLNFLVTWQTWREDPRRSARLHFVSTELHPFTREDLATLHARWPQLAALAAELQRNWPPLTSGFHHMLLDGGQVSLTLLFGDAYASLRQLVGYADAIYLDGFAPQKNPQLWSTALLELVTRHAAPDATLASWCVAGEVRRALAAQGWQVSKHAGFARKRHMLAARFARQRSKASEPDRSVIVIGAGIAGCAAVEAFARRGWEVTLLERNREPAMEASGNPAGLLHPMLAKDDNLAARFSRAAYLYTLRLLERLGHDKVRWKAEGILQIAASRDGNGGSDEATLKACCTDFPPDYVRWLDCEAASAHAGAAVSAGACWFPHGAWVDPGTLCRELLDQATAITGPRLITCYQCNVARLQYVDGRWHAFDANGRVLASAAHLVLANAAAGTALVPDIQLTLRNIRGQLSYLPPAALSAVRMPLSGVGYAIRTDMLGLIGASFVENDEHAELRTSEHADNLAKLAQLLPGLDATARFDPASLPGRVSFRAASHDRLPLVGSLPQAQLKVQHTLDNLPRQPGLHALLGFGARGLSWAPFAAELLAAQLEAEILPLERALLRALDAARHHLRWHRRNRYNTSE